MVEQGEQGDYYGQVFGDLNARIRDLEEKQRLLKDRMVLISDSFVKERNKNFDELEEMKKTVERINDENQRLKVILFRIGGMLDKSARKEELMIIQRQFDLMRGIK